MKNLIFTSLLLCFAISLSAQGKITMQAAPKNEKIMEKNTTFDIKKIDAEIETMAKEVKNNPLVKDWNTPFQTPPFNEIQNKHYMPAFEYAILLAKKDVANIINQKEEPNFENTIAALDRSGELLNRISGVFFNLLYSNTSAELQEISKKIQPKLTEYQNEISLNNELFKKVNIVYNQKAKLNSEQQMLLEKTYLSFVRNGAKLNPAQKKEYSELTMKLTMLNLEFSENVLAATNAFEMVFSSEKELAGIPQSALDIAAAKAEAKGKKGWLFDLSTPSYLAIMKYADNRDLRNKFFLRSASKCYKDGFDNTDVVYQIVRLRQEIAKLLGYEDYASYALEDRMAKDKKHVYNLIDELAKPSREAAEKEIASLEEFAHRHGLEGELQRWDVSYFSEKQKNEMFDFNEEELKEYFKLENVIDGVFGLAKMLYGLEFKENNKIQVYQKDVKVYNVLRNNKQIAVLYLDFFPRDNKKGGAWMTSFRDQHKKENGENVIPLVQLVMNFTPSTAKNPSLLTFDELTTFMHEFGHALHGMLSDVTYSGLSGTSVPRDFVELPSQINENWASDIKFLRSFAKHYKTGKVIPAELVSKVKKMENYMAGYASCRQLSYALLDMTWHDAKGIDKDIKEIEKEAMALSEFFPEVEESCMSTSFSHIFAGGYAAGYYSYKWSEVLDADAFSLFEENGIFDKKTAQKFYDCILSKGGSRDAMKMFIDFRGREPEVKALLKRSGLL